MSSSDPGATTRPAKVKAAGAAKSAPSSKRQRTDAGPGAAGKGASGRAAAAGSQLGPRRKLPGVSELSHVLELLRRSRRILVLTGAGISVSCGIPDFRSANGVYAMVEALGLSLPQPECLFDIEYFRDDPRPFFAFAKRLFPGANYRPSPTHRFLRLLELKKKLLRNYTQARAETTTL